MRSNLWILVLLAGCRKDDAESENPFDDWGPYKSCTQDIVYTDYDVKTSEAEPDPGDLRVSVHTAQGGLLESDYYRRASDGTLTFNDATYCSYDEDTHAPLACDIFLDPDKKPSLYSTETYGYRADGLIAWVSETFFNGSVNVYTTTRDESDRVVRVDFDHSSDGALDGMPDSSDVSIYDGDDTVPSEIDRYRDGIVDDEHLELSLRNVVENDLAVHGELVSSDGSVEAHDYTYDNDDHLLTDVRDGGWEITTYTYDHRGFWATGTHQLAWNELSDLRTDSTVDVEYDCEAL
jgi:YD repeat-containing protein